MRVVHAPLEVMFITDSVFPIAFLPDAALPVLDARFGLRQLDPARIEPMLGELFFDSHPAQRISVVAGWQSPSRMPMIGQQDDGHDLERMVRFDFVDGFAELHENLHRYVREVVPTLPDTEAFSMCVFLESDCYRPQ